ncbi:hypothetical protein SAMN05421666_1187 [Roseovarius nanhaiticus]|uniref:Uncharacterized protein n=1 Tax=Roseovarius nanhaiticus TaxID=573024 RepID=A0A1N7FMY3_9RHOB|nr:hypothetical protein [Roseovarius nanhaiticus]SEK50637.1 hypothetical protein SAMN05216208_0949 [Roseovarius nanhaiticus]SIS01596.1 hypothetical protein SAMN05421666_1187 [Roseovarius nanhaiticus]
MVDPKTFQADIDALSQKLRSRVGARGRSLEAQLRRAGRALPKAARQGGSRLVKLEKMMAHPRLRRLVRAEDVAAALGAVSAPLDQIDVKERRKDRALRLAGSTVGNLLILGALIVILLRWRGLV